MNRSGRPTRRTAAIAAAAVATLALATLPASAAFAAPAAAAACDNRNNNTISKLLECVSVDGVKEHLQAFQDIATANNGNRSVASPGYEASADYVVDQLTAAGWDVSEDVFDFAFQPNAEIQQLTPTAVNHPSAYFTLAVLGEVTGGVIPVDLAIANPATSTSGCQATDFAGLDFSGPNDIALIQRGACSFAIKVNNAQAAGAEAAIIFNQGSNSTNQGVITNVTLNDGVSPIPTIPAAPTSFAAGQTLAQAGSTARVETLGVENRPQRNIIAELPGVNDDNVVMAGAHLDSVPAGPGINDNGSGSAALIEVAQNLSKLKPQNTIRLAWWAAEEVGLVGSYSYVDRLPQEERDRIALYLNFDMIGSPNYIFMIYDGDESGFPAPNGVPIPEGSIQIEDLFEQYFTSVGEPYDDAQFSGRSDYAGFIEVGIPAGGLFTGAEVVKTAEQASIWGGTAGQAFDPCYHQVCDTMANVNDHALEVNSDAVALSVLAYSYSTELVNGVVGRSIPGGLKLPVADGPVEMLSTDISGFEHDHHPEGE
ncbi:M28 family metallopeptidase [Microbacterium sp. 2FI]|uniref:M28 family metallopeptidase n=1 Tax=Microbacterium sp. 2FI TaxID=2502193 RepID=UPI0010F95F80|nr:M28 family metallopeptidase [Microbacterium sp. 2FI]